MRITQWQDFETKILYDEIFGPNSVYERGGLKYGPGQTIVDAGVCARAGYAARGAARSPFPMRRRRERRAMGRCVAATRIAACSFVAASRRR